MTQKEIDEFLAYTKVYVAGKSKEIQEKLFSLGFYCCTDAQVSYTEKPFLFLAERKEIKYGDDMVYFTEHEYREITAEQILSLELTEPTYRPFKDAEECWNEMHKHPDFGWVKRVQDPAYMNINIVEEIGRIDGWEFKSVFDKITFTDGEPFGIKE